MFNRVAYYGLMFKSIHGHIKRHNTIAFNDRYKQKEKITRVCKKFFNLMKKIDYSFRYEHLVSISN